VSKIPALKTAQLKTQTATVAPNLTLPENGK
jgi:hypothetical protein